MFFLYIFLRLGINWGLSVVLCTIVICSTPIPILLKASSTFCFSFFLLHYLCKGLNTQVCALGAIRYILISSFLTRENILNLVSLLCLHLGFPVMVLKIVFICRSPLTFMLLSPISSWPLV